MDFVLFVIFFAACCGAGATGMAFPPGGWYRSLSKPSWTPPDWAFPVAWTTIYICISIAGARAAGLPGSGLALAFWAMQAAFSTLWTPVFFGLHRIKESLFVMAALWIAVLGSTLSLFQLDWLCGVLFLPYLLWVTIAAALNFSVWRRNPGVPPQNLS